MIAAMAMTRPRARRCAACVSAIDGIACAPRVLFVLSREKR
jgi:hypothetical protein